MGFPFWEFSLEAARKIARLTGINLVDETRELMVISQFGKIIRIDTNSICAVGRSIQGVKLLDLEPQDKVDAAVVIPPEEAEAQPEEGTLLQ
jgi:DNA gyrase subunit A